MMKVFWLVHAKEKDINLKDCEDGEITGHFYFSEEEAIREATCAIEAGLDSRVEDMRGNVLWKPERREGFNEQA